MDASANGQGTLANICIWTASTSPAPSGRASGTSLPSRRHPGIVRPGQHLRRGVRALELIQFAMTTKSGQDRFHGMVSDYYNKESMYASTRSGSDHESTRSTATTFGDGRRPHHSGQAVLLLLRVRNPALVGLHGQPGADVSRPEFAAWARATIRTPSGRRPERVPALQRDGQRRHEHGAEHLPGHVRNPGDHNLPCATPMINSGIFNSSHFQDGLHRPHRQGFRNDRIYASFFRTTLNFGGPDVVPQFSTTNHTTHSPSR